MNILTDPEHLKNLLKSLNFKPQDYLGQNFLVSDDVLDEIISAAEIGSTETTIEIGPGLGVLTQRLARVSNRVIAIEKDERLVPVLKKFFRDNKNVVIVQGDVLKFNFAEVRGQYKIVANIPYYLTSHLLQVLLALDNRPTKIVFMVQKEVGERLVAKAGSLSILGISVQIFSDTSIAAFVPRENFWPKPKVDSSIVVIEPKEKYPEITDHKLFFRMLKICFAGKRKQIHNSLTNGLKIKKSEVLKLLDTAKIPHGARPQELEIEQWVQLFSTIRSRQG